MTEPTADQIRNAVQERYGSRAREQLKKEEAIPIAAVGEDA